MKCPINTHLRAQAASVLLLLFTVQCTAPQPSPVSDPIRQTEPEVEPGTFLYIDTDQLLQAAADAYQEQDYRLASEKYLEYLQYNVKDAVAVYNLACCYALQEDAPRAAQFLKRAVDLGFDNYPHILQDRDFLAVRDSEEFRNVLKLVAILETKNTNESGEVWYFRGEQFRKGRLVLPQDYHLKRKYPLVVGLHGIGGSADNFVRVFNGVENRSFIYLALQAPYPFETGDGIGYSWNLRYTDETKLSIQSWELAAAWIISAVKEFGRYYDFSDVYLMGFSQGAGTAILTGILHHEHVTGVLQYGGWLDSEVLTDDKIQEASDLDVLILHGTLDQSVPFEEAQIARETLEDAGYQVTIEEFEGGHEITPEMVQIMADWIHSRK